MHVLPSSDEKGKRSDTTERKERERQGQRPGTTGGNWFISFLFCWCCCCPSFSSPHLFRSSSFRRTQPKYTSKFSYVYSSSLLRIFFFGAHTLDNSDYECDPFSSCKTEGGSLGAGARPESPWAICPLSPEGANSRHTHLGEAAASVTLQRSTSPLFPPRRRACQETAVHQSPSAQYTSHALHAPEEHPSPHTRSLALAFPRYIHIHHHHHPPIGGAYYRKPKLPPPFPRPPPPGPPWCQAPDAPRGRSMQTMARKRRQGETSAWRARSAGAGTPVARSIACVGWVGWGAGCGTVDWLVG